MTYVLISIIKYIEQNNFSTVKQDLSPNEFDIKNRILLSIMPKCVM